MIFFHILQIGVNSSKIDGALGTVVPLLLRSFVLVECYPAFCKSYDLKVTPNLLSIEQTKVQKTREKLILEVKIPVGEDGMSLT